MIDIADAIKAVMDVHIKLGYGVYGHNVGAYQVMADLLKAHYIIKAII